MPRILIVEDDIELCMFLSDELGDEGFETGVANDGERALAMLEQYKPLPDIILLDLHMPGMNGWTFREKLKENPAYAKIPIIIMSGDLACTEVEADAHLIKPFDLKNFLDLLHNRFKKKAS